MWRSLSHPSPLNNRPPHKPPIMPRHSHPNSSPHLPTPNNSPLSQCRPEYQTQLLPAPHNNKQLYLLSTPVNSPLLVHRPSMQLEPHPMLQAGPCFRPRPKCHLSRPPPSSRPLTSCKSRKSTWRARIWILLLLWFTIRPRPPQLPLGVSMGLLTKSLYPQPLCQPCNTNINSNILGVIFNSHNNNKKEPQVSL